MQIYRSSRLATLLGTLVIVLAACSGGGASPSGARSPSAAASVAVPSAAASAIPSTPASASTPAGSGGAKVDLSGASLTVGSKEFTEQLILGQMTILMLKDAGATVKDQTGLVGSKVVRAALVSGDIDMYWEYTGTGWITHQGNTKPIAGSQEQFDAVKKADAANKIVWLDPAPFDNTYAIALTTEKATELNLKTLSDLATWANANADKATMCGAAEFLGRDDGLPGLEAAYGFKFVTPSELDLGLVYTSVDKGDPCIFGEVFATDSRIAKLGLTVLEDDKHFFPSYLPALNVRQEVFDKYPKLADLIAPLAKVLDSATMLTLNSKVDNEGQRAPKVAEDFLKEKGLIGK